MRRNLRDGHRWPWRKPRPGRAVLDPAARPGGPGERQGGDEARWPSHQVLERVFASTQVMIAVLDADFNFVRVNPAYAAADGRPPEFFPGKNHFVLYPHPENEAIFRRVVATREPYTAYAKPFEYAGHPERGVSYWDWTVQPLPGPEGKVEALIFTLRDVSERVHAEADRVRLAEERAAREAAEAEVAERRRAEAQLRQLSRAVEQSSASIIITGVDGAIEYVNPAFTRVTGYSREEVLGRNPRLLKSGDTSPEEYARLWHTITAGGEWRGEFHNRKKSGELFWEAASIAPVRDPAGAIAHFVAVKEDITELKRAEEELRYQKDLLRTVTDNASTAILLMDPRGRGLFVNPAAERATGFRADELVGRVLHARIHHHRPDGSPYPRQACPLDRSLPLNEPVRDLEDAIVRKDGTFLPVACSASPVLRDGRPVATVIELRDITERKRAEAALAEERERLAVTLRSIGDGVIAADTGARVVLLNPVAEALTGWTQEAALGRPVAEVFHIVNEDSRAPAENPVARVLRTGGTVGLANHTALIARDGQARLIADSGAPIRTPDGRVLGVVLVFRDVTEQRRLDAELARINKLDALGVLAGGIAHDFNNILTAVLANASLAKMSSPAGGKVHQWLVEVEKASRRAKDLTQQLLTFAKGGAPILQPAAMGELLRDTATFTLSGTNVQPELCLAEDLWPAEVDAGQISQVIQNLVLNAQQAMPAGGAVRVSADNVTLGTDSGLPLAPGRYLRVTVADHGGGIPPDLLPRIFDPFFTTKQSGSGLGLAMAHSVVKKHGGHITVDSTPGAGTAFTVYLPAAVGARPAAAAGDEAAAGHGRILAMDDEVPVRELLREALTVLGYEVALAADGAEAVEAYRRARDAGEPFDAVILDLTVPGGMGGLETLRALRGFDPEVRAIVSSGYAADSVMADFRAYGFAGAAAKPYAVEELSRVVREVLGRGSNAQFTTIEPLGRPG